MFVDLYFPVGLAADRDEIQRAIEALLDGDVEVVGAAIGSSGSNLDLELSPTIDLISALTKIEQVLRGFGVPDATVIAISDRSEPLSLAELRSRLNEWHSRTLTEVRRVVSTFTP